MCTAVLGFKCILGIQTQAFLMSGKCFACWVISLADQESYENTTCVGPWAQPCYTSVPLSNVQEHWYTHATRWRFQNGLTLNVLDSTLNVLDSYEALELGRKGRP